MTDASDNSPTAETYKRREVPLILLNIGVLAALFVVHVGFLWQIGAPSAALLATLAIRFVLLIGELYWLQRLDDHTDAKILAIHGRVAIVLNIVFAFAASLLGGTADSHYSVLMIIPIIQAAFRFRLGPTLAIVAATVILTFLEVWIFFLRRPPVEYGEFFEAATVSLIFLVVGVVVQLLAGGLRGEEIKLQTSLRELRETQARLVAEEKLAAVGALAGSIAHEIRNPVAMIASSLEMAAKQPVGTPLRSEMMDIAAVESKRLETLTDDFLSFARRRELSVKSENVRDTLAYVASLAKARFSERRIEIEVDCEPQLAASFDAGQIQQALLNLMINAADASADDGVVRVGATRSNTVVLFVENEGEAIGADEADRLFEPFFTTKPRGTGLGLAIVGNIAKAHGGVCRLAVNQPRHVRFEIELPA